MESKKDENNFSKILPLNNYLCKVSKSICKIKTSKSKGTGFLIKLDRNNNPFYCLMTNEHVIKKQIINSKEKIEISYDSGFQRTEISLDQTERYIKDYLYFGIDAIIIEILDEDKINEDYFLLPNLEYLNGYDKYMNKKIYIPQYIEGKHLSYSSGEIKKIENNELIYFAGTNKGSSGSPIFIEDTIKVIGIHKQKSKDNCGNFGNFIGQIIESLKKNLNYAQKDYDKDKYKGELRDKIIIQYKLYGEYGEYIIPEEEKIFIREGFGEYEWENGEYYSGYWINDKKNGKGRLYYKNATIKYEGDFVNDRKEGYGKYILKNGKYYYGYWLNDLRHGKGILYYKNDTIEYEGTFVNDKREGFGKYINENGEFYIGHWLNDKKDGEGILYYKKGSIKYIGNY